MPYAYETTGQLNTLSASVWAMHGSVETSLKYLGAVWSYLISSLFIVALLA